MKNAKLDRVKSKIIDLLKADFGYCGSMENEDQVILNTGNGEDDFRITIKDESD